MYCICIVFCPLYPAEFTTIYSYLFMAFASKDGNRRERRTKKNGKLFKAIIYQMYIYIYMCNFRIYSTYMTNNQLLLPTPLVFFLLMLGTNAFRIPYSCDRVSWFYFRLYFWTKMHFFLLEGDTNWGLSDWVMGWLNSCGMHFNCRRSRHIVAFSANSQKHFHTLANLVRVTLCCYSHWILYFQAEWTNDGGKST